MVGYDPMYLRNIFLPLTMRILITVYGAQVVLIAHYNVWHKLYLCVNLKATDFVAAIFE
jgi:hypothetical protein